MKAPPRAAGPSTVTVLWEVLWAVLWAVLSLWGVPGYPLGLAVTPAPEWYPVLLHTRKETL